MKNLFLTFIQNSFYENPNHKKNLLKFLKFFCNWSKSLHCDWYLCNTSSSATITRHEKKTPTAAIYTRMKWRWNNHKFGFILHTFPFPFSPFLVHIYLSLIHSMWLSAVSKLKIYADQHLRPCVRRCFPLSVDKVTTFLIKDQLVNTSTPHPVSIPKSQLTPKAECVCQQLARHPRSFGLFAYLPLPEAQIKSSACPPEVDLPERGLQRTGHPLGVDVADKQTSCTVAGWSVMLLRWELWRVCCPPTVPVPGPLLTLE